MGSFSGLLNNASLMLLLCVIYDTFGIYAVPNKRVRDSLTGILVGLIGIAVMLNPWSLQPGVFFDTRWVLLSLCGLFFGFAPTMIAVVIAGSFRLYQGGPGGIVGTVVIVTTACVGVAWKYWSDSRQGSMKWYELYAFGIAVQLMMLLCMLLMPAKMIVPIIKAVAPPILTIFPVLTVLVGLILKRQEARRDAEKELVENRRALMKERGLLRGVINSISDLIFFKDTQGAYLGCNRSFESQVGVDENRLRGKKDDEVFEVNLSDFFMHMDNEVLTNGKAVTIEKMVDFPGNKSLILETVKTPFKGLDGMLHGLVGISRDITERKQAEDERKRLQGQLVQAQKMESVGRLAGGVAHDFNNMLGVILGHAELALDEVDPSQPLYQDLQEINRAANRSADLTRQLLAFARKQTVAPLVLNLNETVNGMLSMLKRLIGEDISLVWLPGSNLNPIKIDPSQLDQILANLCINARDAIKDTGKITIETGSVSFDEAYCEKHAGYLPGDYLLLTVSDDGCGMDEETISRLFEPFFTTKEINKGTGLGLATVYGIVKQNNGFVDVFSKPGLGSIFKIYLPWHAEEKDQVPTALPEKPATPGNETILLAEDEIMILSMAKRILESHGYRVLSAATPLEAIDIAEKHKGNIHLLVTDVIMPKMNGRDLLAKISSLYPGIKSLFMSGYTANVIAHHGVLEEGMHFMQKPFTKDDIISKIRQALDH